MNHLHRLPILPVLAAALLLLSSCFNPIKDELTGLDDRFSKLDQRVQSLQTEASRMNETLERLSVLAAAVEQNFYITDVKETEDGYKLTLSNGCVISFQNGPDNTLSPMPAISMTQISGLFYWTLGGMLLTDSSGYPIRSSGFTPILKYDYTNGQFVISTDGGLTFKSINEYTSIVVNDTVLMQVINNYFSTNSTRLVSRQMLYQIVSTYIQKSYSEAFNIDLLDEVVGNYLRQNYLKIFSYELIDEIFNQYDFEYYTSQIDVDHLVNIIVSFIQEHNEILTNNDILYEIVSSYLSANKTTIFSSEVLLDIINEFIAHHEDLIDVELLTYVVSNYIDEHRDNVFNTETVRNMLKEYVQRFYVRIFSQNLLVQVLNVYVSQNSAEIFNKTLMREILNTYVQNNYTTILTQDILTEIVDEYIKKNADTVLNFDVLYEIINTYFQKNYELVIDRTVIQQVFDSYVERHKDSIIDVSIIESIITEYLRNYYIEVFSIDMLTVVVHDYFDSNTQVIKDFVNYYTDPVSNVTISDDCCTFVLRNGQEVKLVVFDAYARLRDRIQSVIIVPEGNGHVKELDLGNGKGELDLTYLVTPSSMSSIIPSLVAEKIVTLELLSTDDTDDVWNLNVSKYTADNKGHLYVTSLDNYGATKTVALHIKENRTAGTDIITEFTPVDSESQPQTAKLKIVMDLLPDYLSTFDVLSATLYNKTTEEWSDFQIWRGFKDGKNYWYTKPEITLDENSYKVFVWSRNELARDGNIVHFNFIEDLYRGFSNEVSASSPTASIIFEPQMTDITVNVKNNGNDDLRIRRCSINWNLKYTNRLATNANLNLLNGSLEDIKYTPYYQQYLKDCITIKPSASYPFYFSIVPIGDLLYDRLYLRVELENGEEFTKDVFDALGITSDVIFLGAGDKLSMTFPIQWENPATPSTGSYQGHEWVDLGLPSGLRWATCNIGASKPEDYGNYYSWGETSTKSSYSWSNYKYRSSGTTSDNVKFSKYNTQSTRGTVDNIITLKSSDDAASANWKGAWRMPTQSDWLELLNNCTSEWTTQNGVAGYKFTSKANGNSVFLPAAGSMLSSLWDAQTEGLYWTSSLSSSDSVYASTILFKSSQCYKYSSASRSFGLPIRPVCPKLDLPEITPIILL